ncbi:uncharacterized protein Z519_10697 [Cladophialophora bantiana CBS 173.52]|uniref:Uncharacterized protein n=1 Tax=Cladophialophora bantiana (strain ATCC 10958 / CBS 173.52 / CDC B-1940 / NIH 8579) TaxID=1442370 RepID=A0A0D2EF04_CLAB1|nr:uncharacterized protein Z519_10697 [Cladophialophora bantiana CBS 173.52]KIW88651.1 hypothetical protein Z519_10697 [Cladophialophora bantiana CBS 173.52]
MALKNLTDPNITGLEPAQVKAIDTEIAQKAASLQVDGYIVRGYSTGERNFGLIQKSLVDLVTSCNQPDTVVHNSSGPYASSGLK